MYEYQIKQRVARRSTSVGLCTKDGAYPLSRGSVVTLLEPALRDLVTVATSGTFVSVHAETLEAACRALEDEEAHAVLLSPGAIEGERICDVASLLSRHPGVFPVAVVHRHGPGVSEGVLALGRCGVARIVDLDSAGGCQALRATLEESGGVIGRRISASVGAQLAGASESSLRFFSYLVRSAPTHATVREFSRFLEVNPSTLMSRFLRAGLPSPKQYLAHTRLLYAAAYLESAGLSIADVAYRLEYSSPQSFGRHIRTMMDISSARRQFSK